MAPTGHHGKDLFTQWLCQKELLAILMDPLDNPPNLPADKASPAKTPWDSETPSPKEWRACDAWTLGLLLINTKC